MRRGALNPFFAKRSVYRLEPRIQEKIDVLCNRMDEFSGKKDVIKLHVAYTALTMDIIREYCYGTCPNFLYQPDFNLEWKECMDIMCEGTAFRRATPWITKLMQKLPEEYVLRMIPAFGVLISWQQGIKAQVGEIVNAKKSNGSKESVFQSLLDSDALPDHEKTVQRLADEGEILVAAGSETTARTLSYTSFHILNTPGVLQKLREELKSVMPAAPAAISKGCKT